MTYRPHASTFGPPFSARIPSLIYVGVALFVVGVVVAGEMSPSNTWLHVYIVEKDVTRVLGARTLAAVVCISALAAVLKTGMRGVRIRGDGLQYRDVLSLGWPRVRHYRWAQIDRIVLDQPTAIALDLWDGTRAFLPEVGDRDGLAQVLEHVAAARAIPVQGGAGLDELPDSTQYDA